MLSQMYDALYHCRSPIYSLHVVNANTITTGDDSGVIKVIGLHNHKCVMVMQLQYMTKPSPSFSRSNLLVVLFE